MIRTTDMSLKKLVSRQRVTWLILILIVLFVNADIMVLELIAGRLTAKYLGQSLYTWTTIIGVVLAGISLGAYVSGRLLDRFNSKRLLVICFVVSSSLCMATVPFNIYIGSWDFLHNLSWPFRIFCHLALLFFLPSAFLGAINPIVARYALDYMHSTGKGIGIIYSSAGAGSVIGIFSAGFVFIPFLASSTIIITTSFMLSFLALFTIFALKSEPSKAAISISSKKLSQESVLYANATIFISNFSIMTLELAASRIATHNLGHSLFTWTTLLGFVLFGITFGNLLGGILADKFSGKSLTASLFTGSAIATLSVPIISNWLTGAELLANLPWVVHIGLYNFLSFTLPAMFMGALSPVITIRALSSSNLPGKVLGGLYAWGSVGSVTGTFLAGYVLIDKIWPVGTLSIIALGLALVAIMYRPRSLISYAGLIVSITACVCTFGSWNITKQLGAKLGFQNEVDELVIYQDHTQYSWIEIRKSAIDPNILLLELDSLLHSEVNISNPMDLLYNYQWIYDAILKEYFPRETPLNSLMVGGGGFVFPRYLEVSRPGSAIEVVEIDPAVTHAAREAFGLSKDSTIEVLDMDGRNRVDELMRQKKMGRYVAPFDCILADSFNQYSVPFQLTTLEYHRSIAKLLSNGGIYMLNVVDAFPEAEFLASITNTCRTVFPYVYVLSCAPIESNSRDTFVVVASKRELSLARIPEQIRLKNGYRGELIDQIRLDTLIRENGSRILTDDFAPVDNMLLRVAKSQDILPIETVEHQISRAVEDSRYEDAVRLIESELKRKPRSAYLKHTLVFILGRMGEFEKMIPICEELVNQNPNDYRAQHNWAAALASCGRIEDAIPHYEKAIGIEPNMPQSHFALGTYWYSNGDMDKAHLHFEETLKFQPNNDLAHHKTGLILSEKEDFAAALRHFKSALRTLSQNHELQNDIGMLHLSSGNSALAIGSFEKAIDLSPKSMTAYLNLGGTHYLNGNIDMAIAVYKSAIEYQPGYLPPHYNLAKSYSKLGRNREAIEQYELCIELDPEFTKAHEALSLLGQ